MAKLGENQKSYHVTWNGRFVIHRDFFFSHLWGKIHSYTAIENLLVSPLVGKSRPQFLLLWNDTLWIHATTVEVLWCNFMLCHNKTSSEMTKFSLKPHFVWQNINQVVIVLGIHKFGQLSTRFSCFSETKFFLFDSYRSKRIWL